MPFKQFLKHELSSDFRFKGLSTFDHKVHFLFNHVHLQISSVYLVPPIITFLAKHPLVANYDLTSIDTIISGAAPLGEELTHTVRERIPTVVALGQGMCHIMMGVQIDRLP